MITMKERKKSFSPEEFFRKKSVVVAGVLFSALLLGEKVLTVNNLLALALVSLGIIIVNYYDRKTA